MAGTSACSTWTSSPTPSRLATCRSMSRSTASAAGSGSLTPTCTTGAIPARRGPTSRQLRSPSSPRCLLHSDRSSPRPERVALAVAGSGLRLAVGQHDYFGADAERLHERQVTGNRAVPEQPLARADQHRVDHEPVFIDESVLPQRVDKRCTAVDKDVAVVLLLELGHLKGDVARDDRAVPPRRLGERGRHDELRHGVHARAEVPRGFFHRLPRGSEPVVGDPAEQQRVAGLQLVELVRLTTGRGMTEAPPALRRSLGSAGILDDAVDRDEFADY